MGDKGGKKDKEKSQQQHVKKTQDKEQQRLDKARPSSSSPSARQPVAAALHAPGGRPR